MDAGDRATPGAVAEDGVIYRAEGTHPQQNYPPNDDFFYAFYKSYLLTLVIVVNTIPSHKKTAYWRSFSCS